MVRLTSEPVSKRKRGKNGEGKALQRRWKDVCKTLAYIPPATSTIKKKKWCFISSYFFNRGPYICPSNLLPSNPRTLTRRGKQEHNLQPSLRRRGGSSLIETSQKNCSPRQTKEVPSVAALLPLLSCQSQRQALDTAGLGSRGCCRSRVCSRGCV